MSYVYSRREFLRASASVFGPVAGMASLAIGSTALSAEARFRPRFAICNETFGDWPLERAFAFSAECGYQGIELAPFTISDYVTDISPAKRQAIRRQAETAGIDVVGLHWLLARTQGFHLTSPDRDVRRRTSEYLGALAEFCADVGGKLLVFGSPKQRDVADGVRREDAIGYAAEVIRQSLPTLEKTGTRLALEPLSPQTTNFLRNAAEVVELVEIVDSSRCRLILDCNAMASERKSPAELIRQYQSYLLHLHANDPNGQGPGFGQLDFIPIFDALRDVQYGGWVSVEVFDYTPGPERLARDSIQYMQKCLAQVRPQ